MTDLVSIIMPCFNSEDTIKRAIDSVRNQTYENWELLITDDLSTDNSIEVIRVEASGDSRIKLFCLAENGGAGVARNNSIGQARGRYIAFLDADDYWVADKLERQVGFMRENRIALTYSAYQKVKLGEPAGIVTPPSQVTYQQLVYSNVIGCLTAIYDASVLGKRFMPLIRKRQDMGLWLDILRDIECAVVTPGVLAFYDCDTGMTKNKFTVLGYQWRFYRDVLKLGFARSTVVFCVYAFKGLRKSAV